MTSSEQIIVRIGTDGSITAETKGMTGPKCLDTVSLLEDLLEAQATTSEFLPEYSVTSTDETSEEYDDLRQY